MESPGTPLRCISFSCGPCRASTCGCSVPVNTDYPRTKTSLSLKRRGALPVLGDRWSSLLSVWPTVPRPVQSVLRLPRIARVRLDWARSSGSIGFLMQAVSESSFSISVGTRRTSRTLMSSMLFSSRCAAARLLSIFGLCRRRSHMVFDCPNASQSASLAVILWLQRFCVFPRVF